MSADEVYSELARLWEHEGKNYPEDLDHTLLKLAKESPEDYQKLMEQHPSKMMLMNNDYVDPVELGKRIFYTPYNGFVGDFDYVKDLWKLHGMQFDDMDYEWLKEEVHRYYLVGDDGVPGDEHRKSLWEWFEEMYGVSPDNPKALFEW